MKKLLLIFLFFGCTIAYSQGKDTTNLKQQQQVDILGQQIELLNKELGISKETIASLNVKVKEVKSESKEETDYYLNHISTVLMAIGILITFLAAVVGIGGPIFFNGSIRDYIKERIADLKKEIEEVKKLKEEVTEAKIEINKITEIVEAHVEDINVIKTKIDKQEVSATESAKQAMVSATESAERAMVSALFSEAYSEKDIEKQVILYTKIIELDTTFSSIYNNRGGAYSDKKEYGKAIADYTKAIEIDPKYTSAYYNRGNAYSKKGESDNAIADYTKAIEIDPKYASAYNGLADIYCLNKGKDIMLSDDAIIYINKAIELDPTEAIYYHTKFEVYEILEKQEEAEDKKLEYQKIASENKAIYDELIKVK